MKNLEAKNQQPVAATETAVRPGDFKVTAHRAPSAPMGVPEDAVRVDTPAAGDCLFWSVMLSALLRFKGRDDFPALVAGLFGTAGDENCVTRLQEVLLPAYGGRVSDIENLNSGAVLYTLMLAFRRRVAQHLQTTTSHQGSIVGDVQDYCDRMAQAGAWGGELEVKAMAELLGVDIVICREGELPRRLRAELGAAAGEVLHIAQVSAGGNDAKSSERNHYVYYARAAECDWAATSDPLPSPEAKQPHAQGREKLASAVDSAAEDKKMITPQKHLEWDRLISGIADEASPAKGTPAGEALTKAYRELYIYLGEAEYAELITEKLREQSDLSAMESCLLCKARSLRKLQKSAGNETAASKTDNRIQKLKTASRKRTDGAGKEQRLKEEIDKMAEHLKCAWGEKIVMDACSVVSEEKTAFGSNSFATRIAKLQEKIQEIEKKQETNNIINGFRYLGQCFNHMKHYDLSLYFFGRAYGLFTGIVIEKQIIQASDMLLVVSNWAEALSALGHEAKAEESSGECLNSAEGVIESGIKKLNELKESLETLHDGSLEKKIRGVQQARARQQRADSTFTSLKDERQKVITGLINLYRSQADVYSDCSDEKKRKKREQALSDFYDLLILLRGEADAQVQEKASSGPQLTGAFLAQLHVRSPNALDRANHPSLAAVFSWIMEEKKPQKRFDLFYSALEYATKYRRQVGQAPATETSVAGVTLPVAMNLDAVINDYEKKAGGGLDYSQQSDLEFMRARAAYFRQDYNAAIAISNALMGSQKRKTPDQQDAKAQVGIRMKATKYIRCVELLVSATQASASSASDDARYQAVKAIYQQETSDWQAKGYPYLALHFLDKALRYAEINNRQDEVHQITQAKRAFIESNLLNGDSIAPNTVRDDINQEYEDCVMRFIEIQSLRLISHANNDIYDFLNKDGGTRIAREQYQKIISLILLMHSLMDQSYQQFTGNGYFLVSETQFPAHAKNRSPRFLPLYLQAHNGKRNAVGKQKNERKKEFNIVDKQIIPKLEKHPKLFFGFADSKARVQAFIAYCLFVNVKFKKPETKLAHLIGALVKAQADDPHCSFLAIVESEVQSQIKALCVNIPDNKKQILQGKLAGFHSDCMQSAGALLGGYTEAELSRSWEAKDTRTPYDPALFKIHVLSNYFKHVAISIPDERVNKNKKVGLLRTIEVDRWMRVRRPDPSNTKNKLYNNVDFELARDEKTQGLPQSEAEVLAYFQSCEILVKNSQANKADDKKKNKATEKMILNEQGLKKEMTLDEFTKQMQESVAQKAIDDGEAGRATQLQYQPWVNHMLPYLYAEYQVDNDLRSPSEAGYPIANLDLFLWQGLMAVREVINDFVPSATATPAAAVLPSALDAKLSPSAPIDSEALAFYQAQEGAARSLYLKAHYGRQAAQYFLHCGGQVSEAVAVFNRVIGYLDSLGHQRASVDFSSTCLKWLSPHADEKVLADFERTNSDREKKFEDKEDRRVKDKTTLLDSFYEIQTLFFDHFIAQAVRCLPMEPSGVIAGIDPSALDKLSMIFRGVMIRLYTLFDQLEPKQIADSAAPGDSQQPMQKAIPDAKSLPVSQFFNTNQADIKYIKDLAGESKHKKLLRIHCEQGSGVEWEARFLIGPVPEKKIDTPLAILPIVQRLLAALAKEPALLACSAPARKKRVADTQAERQADSSRLGMFRTQKNCVSEPSSKEKGSQNLLNLGLGHQSSRYSASSSVAGGASFGMLNSSPASIDSLADSEPTERSLSRPHI